MDGAPCGGWIVRVLHMRAGKETKPTGPGVVIVVPRLNRLDCVGPATRLSLLADPALPAHGMDSRSGLKKYKCIVHTSHTFLKAGPVHISWNMEDSEIPNILMNTYTH